MIPKQKKLDALNADIRGMVKAIRLYYHMHNTESQKCTLVEARDYVEQLKTKMKERGEL